MEAELRYEVDNPSLNLEDKVFEEGVGVVIPKVDVTLSGRQRLEAHRNIVRGRQIVGRN